MNKVRQTSRTSRRKTTQLICPPAIAFQSAPVPGRQSHTHKQSDSAAALYGGGADGRLPITACQIIHRINNNGELFASRVAPRSKAQNLEQVRAAFCSAAATTQNRPRARYGFNFNLASASLLLSSTVAANLGGFVLCLYQC